jgi:beta-glucuronidase
MLRPKDTATRQRKSLDGLWRFAIDPNGVGRDEAWWRGPLPGRCEAPVPASYNDLFVDPAVHDHVGDVWYQTVVMVPAHWAGERIILRFDSATHRAVVWVGETRVMEHQGGYTPFEADITDVVQVGAENRITAAVSNVLTWQSIPPGRVEQTPDGPRQRYFHDFFNYAGLHRSVWLFTRPAAHISDISVVTGLDGTAGPYDTPWQRRVHKERPCTSHFGIPGTPR